MSKKNSASPKPLLMERPVRARALEEETVPTVQQEISNEMLAQLEVLGSKIAGQAGIIYEGEQFRLPLSMRGNLDAAMARIKEIKSSDEGMITFTRTFPFRPDDGAVAFARAMTMVFGTQGVGKTIHTLMGDIKPEIRMVQTGLGEYAEAPQGLVAFGGLKAKFTIGRDWDPERGYTFRIGCECPRMYRQRVEGFFEVIDHILRAESIYKGKAITAAEQPGFFDPFAVDASRVVFTAGVAAQLDETVFTPILHADRLREDGIPVKRCVMLAGPYGTGKSLSGMLAAQVAVRAGWTFILVRAEDDAMDALKTARLYAPAVVFAEDMDNLATADQSRDEITYLLDAVDSVSVKGQEIMLISTTNFPDDIDLSMLRPGRTDVIIDFGYLDAEGYTRLIPAVLPASRLAKDIRYEKVAEAFSGLYPAFATEACYRAAFRSLRANDGRQVPITEEDLLAGAGLMHKHRTRMEEAREARRKVPGVESTLVELLEGVLNRTTYRDQAFEVVDTR